MPAGLVRAAVEVAARCQRRTAAFLASGANRTGLAMLPDHTGQGARVGASRAGIGGETAGNSRRIAGVFLGCAKAAARNPWWRLFYAPTGRASRELRSSIPVSVG